MEIPNESTPPPAPQPTFRILGPLQVVGEGGGSLRLDAPRQRVVLAMLLLEANRIIPVERLVDAIWHESPPPTARSQIQICVSAIRRGLAECGLTDVIETRAPGYQLRVDARDFDLHLFDRLTARAREAIASGRLADAASAYREALGLWTGQPLAGLESRLVQAAAVQIAERLMVALEECIDIELQLGRHHQVVGELMTQVAAHPLRERLSALLMLALYRSGRQAEALAVYRQARRDFVEEIGLEPGGELRRLERAILVGDADLALSASSPVTAGPVGADPIVPGPQLLPADVADFTGRTELLAELVDVLSAPVAPQDEPGAVRIVAIAGLGGVGKTALALHLAHLVRASFPGGQLHAQLHGTESHPRSPGQALERFLRFLGVDGFTLPDGIEARAEMYRNLLSRRRALVVLDDAADERQVLPLLPGAGQCMVIVTSRFRLTGLSSAHHVDLDVLSADQAMEMLATAIGPERVNAEPEAALALVNLCGRLPLAIRIGAARLGARPHWAISQLTSRLSDEGRRLDELVHHGVGVRPSIAVAYDSLEPRAQLLFRLLGMLDTPDVAGWVAGPLLDVDLMDGEDLLEEIVDVRLLDAEQSGGSTRYRFHDLVRVYARERLFVEEGPAERLAALRRVLRGWLALAREAHRRQYGGDYTVLSGYEPGWEFPPAVLDELLAEPLDWLEGERGRLAAAVRQASDVELDELCWDLAMTTVTLFETRGYYDDWRDTHDVALVSTARSNNRRGQAAMLYSLGALNVVEQRFGEATERLRAALAMFDEIGDDHGRALTLRHLAFIARVNGDLDAAWTGYTDALAGLRGAGDRVGEAHVLGSLAHIKLERKEYGAAEELLRQALEIARSSGGARIEAQLVHRVGEARWLRGDLAGAEQAFAEVLRLARNTGDAIGEAYALHGLGSIQLQQGLPTEAATTLSRAMALANRHGERLIRARICLALAELYGAEGRYTEATGHLETALGLFEEIGAVRWRARTLRLLGEAHRGAGREDAAEAAFAEADRLTRARSAENGPGSP